MGAAFSFVAPCGSQALCLGTTAYVIHKCPTEEQKGIRMAQTDANHKHTNRLIDENSPYLLQHAHNPVDWHPWGDEALRKAKTEDKPIFLSIGYAACHWCHVMERESFENEDIAAILNRHYVSIKVDREQRPDLDQIYMAFTIAMTGAGGWPMSVFLTPDLKPFFAGTYFPPQDFHGRPGFTRVLTEIAAAYRENKQELQESSESIFEQVRGFVSASPSETILTPSLIKKCADTLMGTFDHRHGGFGRAPKFPHGIELSFFLRHYKATGDLGFLRAAEQALTAMADGGIYDHLGGGFARYSTDEKWLVPHFEKMLYDNALLTPVYGEAYQITGNPRYRAVVIETLDWVLREMTDSTGGFYSAMDADSEGEEGKFYVWSKEEIGQLLGDQADLFCHYYNVSDQGNWEGKNILHRSDETERLRRDRNEGEIDRVIAEGKRMLFEARHRRVRPGIDDKILTSWNGLMLSALCRGYQVTGEERFLQAAIRNASFIQQTLVRGGVLTHSYREGKHSEGEFLEDYAFLLRGLIDLFETDPAGDNDWIGFADQLATRAVALFMDGDGHFYLRPADAPDLIMRPRDETDGAIPAAGSIIMKALLKLERITGNKDHLHAAIKALRAVAGLIDKYPSGTASAALALQYYTGDKIEIVLVGSGAEREAMRRAIYDRFIPDRVVAMSETGREPWPLFEGREPGNGQATAYVCRNSVCRLPATTLVQLSEQLDAL